MEPELVQLLDNAMGEGIFSAMNWMVLWPLLINSGVVARKQVCDALDMALLTLEKNQETRPGGGPGAIVYARSRLEALIRQLSATPH